jgi:hypothetical protein
MYLCVRGIDFVSFYDSDIWFWNCSDSVETPILLHSYHWSEHKDWILAPGSLLLMLLSI